MSVSTDSMDPKPKLDIDNLRWSQDLAIKRKQLLDRCVVYSDEDYKILKKAMKRYRCIQTRLLGHRNEDPYPYREDYIFYCFTGDEE